MLRYKLLFFFFLISQYGFSQTCCSAGAPISSSLEIKNKEAKSLAIQLGYEYKSINLLIDNDEPLENDPRTRYGQNILLKVDYTLNRKWAFSAFLPLVHQARKTFSETQNSFGFGDLSLLTQYNIYENELNIFNVSAGIKLPVGKTNHKGSSNIFLSPDMQSGSGSFDFLFRTSYTRSEFLIPFLSSYASLTYKKNGVNESFGETANFDGRRFGFGDELTTLIGFSYLKTYAFGFLIPDVGLKWRWSEANTEQNVSAPNSGGNWLSTPFGISFVPDEMKSIRIYSEVPIYQKLQGLQITTNFTIGIQLNMILQNKKTNSSIK